MLADQFFYDNINDAMRDIVLENDLLAIRATTTTVANQANYSVPADLLQMHHVSYQGTPLKETTVQEAQQQIENMDSTASYPSGVPSVYWMYGASLWLYPAPASPSATDLLLYYNRMPVEVTTLANTPELPARYDNRILEFLLAKAAELDDDNSKYQLKMGEFQSGVRSTKEIEEGPDQFYSFITTSPADNGGYYYDY
jgi:hypothetical protein